MPESEVARMDEDGAALNFSYAEDCFELEEHKKAARRNVLDFIRNRRVRRKISFYKVLIAVLAFVVMFCLYHMINKLIVYYDYAKYGAVSSVIK